MGKYLDINQFYGMCLTARLMYWTDAKNDLVQYSDLETGDNPGILIDGGDQSLVHYYGIAVDKDYVYITDWTKE